MELHKRLKDVISDTEDGGVQKRDRCTISFRTFLSVYLPV